MRLSFFLSSILYGLLAFLLLACNDGNNPQRASVGKEPSSLQAFSLSGQVKVSARELADSDNNDANAEYIFNNTFEKAQEIYAPAKLNGEIPRLC